MSLQAVARMVVAACIVSSSGAAPANEEPIRPLPPRAAQDPARVAIGRRLFNDTRLSANGAVSCASCHDLAKGGADGRDRSVGFDGRRTATNAPSVFNASFNFRQFWDGRADSLEAQVEIVVENPIEMGAKWSEVVAMVRLDPDYRAAFAAAYGGLIARSSIADAIATYERTLTTPDSRFDRYLRGETGALSDEEKDGYAKFKRYGCVACHQGINIGGNMFQRFGLMGDYFADRGSPTDADLGRLRVTGVETDRHVFKVPSLRNVALTAPYLHDGQAGTLEDAVQFMFKYQLGRSASPTDTASIVKFLRTLTGDQAFQP